MENKTLFLVAEVDREADTAEVHYVLRDRTHAQGLASHGRIAFVECSELDRKDALLLAVAEALEVGNAGAALDAIRREIGL